jgi:monofunctional biosynthetic peptidoglycan transglycosylase
MNTKNSASEDGTFLKAQWFDFVPCKSLQKQRERKNGEALYPNKRPRMYFFGKDRSYIRKGLETYFTVLIEIIWGKEHHGGLFEQYQK